MQQTIEYAKKHWPLIVGGVFGLLVIYYLYKSFSASSSTASSTSLGSSNQLQTATATADLQNAQLNAQMTIAGYSADVANNQTAANLQASLVQTAAQLSATQQQTSATEAVDISGQQAAVSIQQIQSDQAVKQTTIEGTTLLGLADTAGQTAVAVQQAKNVVDLAQIQDVNAQIGTLMKYSKHFGTDIQKIAPVIALETGQGGAAPSLADSNAKQGVASSTGATVSAVSSGIGAILSGLFGGA